MGSSCTLGSSCWPAVWASLPPLFFLALRSPCFSCIWEPRILRGLSVFYVDTKRDCSHRKTSAHCPPVGLHSVGQPMLDGHRGHQTPMLDSRGLCPTGEVTHGPSPSGGGRLGNVRSRPFE